ncbi:hypothetical protein OG455_17015 [Kitasatospora sp. NBC_01287]|uniref:hypothetical protein n=1 Tax=Kitasatospora sp. NBC_01287 TaxID=2903573 RepID=UPI002257E12B|nr:hypothetical protein [Kitasatospora sp. NBC_01287]MCX4747199.1 hypothetical protein [Kitasatospora sp. NBC_01287]
MNTTEYCVQLVLVLLVVRQIRGGRLDLAGLVLPIVLVAGTAAYYLRSIPTAGGDLGLELALAGLGTALGIAAGATTRVWATHDEGVHAKAGLAAAALWVGGIGARIVFVLATEHTHFATTVADFSRDQDITGSQAWVAAFVLMALCEAVARLVTIRLRARTARRALAALKLAA